MIITLLHDVVDADYGWFVCKILFLDIVLAGQQSNGIETRLC
jgi:hypothetical protein